MSINSSQHCLDPKAIIETPVKFSINSYFWALPIENLVKVC